MPAFLGRGSHLAVKKVQEFMIKIEKECGSYWVLKCDIKKFFYNINPNILYTLMQKYFADYGDADWFREAYNEKSEFFKTKFVEDKNKENN